MCRRANRRVQPATWMLAWILDGRDMASRTERSTEARYLPPWYQEPAVLSAIIGALAVVLAAIVTGLFGLVNLGTTPGDVVGNADDTAAAQAAAEQVPTSPITFETFLATMSNPDLTELQRRVFLDEQVNRRVEWEGVVRTVTPAEGGEEKRYLLGLAPEPNASRTAACWFAAGWGTDLLALKPGQRVIVTGVLTRYDGAAPVLHSC